MRQGSIEDIILKYSRRGMPVLRELLPENYCLDAAEEILSWERGTVLLTTGFYVAGYAETDGPLGTMALAGALRKLGFFPVIVTDRYCEGYFEAEDIAVEYMDLDADDAAADAILEKYQPVGLISIERCGRDLNGIYANMRHVDISAGTAPCDALFLKALGTIPTIGVGDGGNEIGMGNVAEAVRTRLDLVPAEVKADILVIATVSNWGAYGIVAALDRAIQHSNMGRMAMLCRNKQYKEIPFQVRHCARKGRLDRSQREGDGFVVQLFQYLQK